MANEPVYIFDAFRLDSGRRQLQRGDEPVALGQRALEVLLALVRRRGGLATKAELMAEVWPDTVVEENNLTTQIVSLRKSLGCCETRRFILTVAGRGYRFVWPIEDAPAAEPDTSAAAAPPTTPPAAAPPPPPEPAGEAARHNLPLEPNSFIGRASELADIEARLGKRRLLTLTGSGGVGKSRAALRVGRTLLERFTDGVWLVELAPLNDPALVAETLCRVLNLPLSGERDATEVAVSFLRARTLLLLLDNCEHLPEASARLAATLLAQCPGVSILATSRQPLAIDGEHVFRMPSLPVPPASPRLTAAEALRSDAVRLFVARAAAAAGDYTLSDEDAPAIAMICRRLDGVAMATELAAARLRILKPAEIAARLEDVFRLLTGGSKAALPRQQTLRATIDWSHALLSPDEQVLFRRLAVFVDGFTLDAAIAVAETAPIATGDLIELLTALVDKSLLAADTSGAVTRYRMLSTTRQYAAEKLAAAEGAEQERRFAEYMAMVAGQAERSWAVTGTDAWAATFAPDIENLRAAVDWCFGDRGRARDAPLGIALVANMGSLAEELSLQADMRRWTAAALRHVSAATPPALEGWVLYWANRHQGVRSTGEVLQARRRAVVLFREADDVVGLASALRAAAIASARPGEPNAEAFAAMRESLALLEPRGASKDLANVLGHLGSLHFFYGDFDQARACNERALAMRRALADRWGVLTSFVNLAEIEAARGNPAAAIDFADKGVAEARTRHALGVLAVTLGNLAGYRLVRDDVGGAVAAAGEALALNRALGYTDYAVICLEHLALAAALDGEPARAAKLHAFTDAHYVATEQIRDRLEQAGVERLLALIESALDDEARQAARAEAATWSAAEADRAALGEDAVPAAPPPAAPVGA